MFARGTNILAWRKHISLGKSNNADAVQHCPHISLSFTIPRDLRKNICSNVACIFLPKVNERKEPSYKTNY